MRRGVLLGLPLVMLFPLLLLVLGIGSASIEAVNECRNQTDQGAVPAELGDLGSIDGPVGGPVQGRIGIASANIPNRSGLSGFRASMPRVLSTNPDFVTLNEIGGRGLAQIETAAPGYSAFREARSTGAGSDQSMGNAVLWKHDVWTRRNAGRVKIVEDDQAIFKGRPVTWDRFATWVLLKRKSDGAVVSIISTHHMTNPQKFPRQHGNPPLTRAQQYGAGMDILLQLRNSLATHGPVLVAGDMNTHPGQANLPWSAAAKMKTVGYGWYNHAVDFVFFPQHHGVKLVKGWTGRMVSDHQWVAARLAMNGAGPDAPATTEAAATVPSLATSNAAAGQTPRGDVATQLMRLRFNDSHPTLTREQARNAITIAQVARDLEVPKYGMQIAITTAIQESKLVNLPGGDRDSAGLFQQRPSQGWGSRAQITNPVLAARAFFGQAQHTSNPGLLDIHGWSTMPLTQAAQAVQRSRYPDAYAQWDGIAGEITALLGGDLPDLPDDGSVSTASNCPQDDTVAPITLGTLNILGAGHTDNRAGGGDRPGYATWDKRLPGALSAIENAGVTIAGLQEVHGPQAKALAQRYSATWGMYPATGNTQNKVIWDRNSWQQTSAQLVKIPYFGGKDVGMPLVQLTGAAGSPNAGQVILVWSIHNPANTRGNAAQLRREALRRQRATMTRLAISGTPVVIVGDFNDGKDGPNASHCTLTPELANAFGGSATPCKKPKNDAPIDHIYGSNLTWATARVDHGTQANKVTDHPLVVATTAGSTLGCAAGKGDYNLGPVKPELERLVNILGLMFDIKTVGGYRGSARDPQGHPSGLAADFMVPLTPAGRAQGDRLAAYARGHAQQLGVDYVIWYQRIWSTDRAAQGWRPMEDRGGATEDHRDHVHINVKPGAKVTGGPSGQCEEVVYPVPAQYRANDARNWHEYSDRRSSWHTGSDISAPCGTPVYAAHGGTIQVDTTQDWSGPWLVMVSTGPGSLTTWYGHMQQLTVSRGEPVQPGQQIGMVGDEGNSSGCHLHFEVHLKNGSIYGPDNADPSAWLDQNVPTMTA